MIVFKTIGFEDLDIFHEYLRWEDVQGCEWSGVNLLTWNRYGLEYAIVEGYLVLRFVYEGQYTHTMPLPPVPEGVEHPRLAVAGDVQILKAYLIILNHLVPSGSYLVLV